MAFFASLAVSQNDHGYEAGRYVAAQARAAFEDKTPSLFIATMSDRYHRPPEVVQGIRSLAKDVPLLGCSSGGGIPTPLGFVEKGVCVLALRLPTPPVLALERGFSQAPADAIHRVATQLQTDTTTGQQTSSPLVLLFTAGGIGSDPATLNTALSSPPITGTDPGMLAGAATGGGQSAHSGMVFVNDEVIEDGVVMGSIKVAAGVGVQADGDVVSAARQAVAASGSPAAALVMGSSSAVFASAQEETTSAPAAPTDQQQLAVVIGRTTPVIGLVGAAVLGAKGGSLHSGAVLVCCMGKEIYP